LIATPPDEHGKKFKFQLENLNEIELGTCKQFGVAGYMEIALPSSGGLGSEWILGAS
jgi:hypothetical protein